MLHLKKTLNTTAIIWLINNYCYCFVLSHSYYSGIWRPYKFFQFLLNGKRMNRVSRVRLCRDRTRPECPKNYAISWLQQFHMWCLRPFHANIIFCLDSMFGCSFWTSCPEIIKLFFMLNSAEHEIFSLLINIKTPTIAEIFISISREIFMLSSDFWNCQGYVKILCST